jgi:AbrB family looped-hinge helix DNA binding protein
VPDDPIIAVAKVLPKGAVQLPPDVRERLGLRPGTKLIALCAEDAVIIRRADVVLERRASRGIMSRLRSVFSQVPIRDAEE